MNCEFFLTSAADGTNCVWVIFNKIIFIYINIITILKQLFEDIIKKAMGYKSSPNKGYMDKVLDLLGDDKLFKEISKDK